jgi:O-acetyl-ADP-ribose deacetylase (regulator of RNase III)
MGREQAMITYVTSDLFTSPARVLVNTVNTVGVMGKGIAKDFKTVYPEMFEQYQKLCEKKQFEVGQLWLYKTEHKWVLNFPTKKHWRQPSRPEYIEEGLKKFANTYHIYGITEISFPLLGCGNGDLDWETRVRPLMEKYLGKLPVTSYIHLHHVKDAFTPEHRNIREIRKWLRGEPESLAFSEVWNDLVELFGETSDVEPLDGGAGFTVRADADNMKLVMIADDGILTLPVDAIMDLWQQVRQAGFVAPDSFPCGLDEYARYVIPVMARLPYLSPATVASKHADISYSSAGLKITPRTCTVPRRWEEQLELMPV